MVGVAGLSLVPVVGGPLSTIVGSSLAAQAQKANLELFALITAVVDDLTQTVDGLNVETIVENPRFLATAEKVVRAARESADQEHRARMIRALLHAGPWSKQEKYATERMTDLLLRIGPVHIFLLRFFADPAKWLTENNGEAWSRGTESMMGGSLISVLGKYVFPNNEVPPGEVARVVAELQRESFMAEAYNLLYTNLSGQGLVEPRLTEFGQSFLAFADAELEP